MKNLLLIILVIFSSNAFATDVTIPTVYGTNGSVTSVNLNGNFTAIAVKINGGLDNENADTTNGYRFFETKSSLPSAGSQGRTIFLTADNTLNLDTGSTFVKSVVTTSTPAQGDVIYYTGSAWADLPAGTSGYFLKTQGTGANPAWTAPTATNLSITSQAQGDIVYYNGASWVRLAAGTSGQYLKTQGTAANPIWGGVVAGISDYGTSASTSTAKTINNFYIAYGSIASVTGDGSQAITNLPFTSSSTYVCNVTIESTNTALTDPVMSVRNSGAQMTIYNASGGAIPVQWECKGT